MGSPYRHVARGRGDTRGSVRYLPNVGVWPLVLALIVAVPGAFYAHRILPPGVVTCTTMDVRPSPDKVCSTMDGRALGHVSTIACRKTPQALENVLASDNPFVSPQITATEIEMPKTPAMPFEAMPGCERKDKTACVDGTTASSSGTAKKGVIIGPGVFINGRPVGTTTALFGDEPPKPAPTVALPPTPSVDTSDHITPEAARALIGKCALTPDSSGPQRTVSVVVIQHDYTRSAMVVLGAFVLALLYMLRRRVRVTLDMTAGTLTIVERGFFLEKRRFAVPAIDVVRAVVGTGPCGPLNGQRVELVLAGNRTEPLITDFVLSISGVHALAAYAVTELLGRARFSSHNLAPLPARSRLSTLAVALGAVATLAVPFGVYAWMRRTPTVRAVPSDASLSRLGTSRDGSTIITAKLGDRRIAIVSDEEGERVRAIDLPTVSAPLADTPDVLSADMTSAPGAMVMDGRGRIFVALPRESAVSVLELAHGKNAALHETARIATEAEPVALSLTKDDASLVVVSNWGHALEAFRTSTMERDFSLDLARGPRALTLSANDSHAVVGHDVGGVLSVVDLRTRELAAPGMWEGVELPGSRRLSRVVADRRDRTHVEAPPPRDFERSPFLQERVARIGDRFYVPAIVATTGDPNDLRAQYYGSRNVLERFDVGTYALGGDRGGVIPVGTLTSTDRPAAGVGARGCLLPRAVVADEAGEWLYVACEGPGQVFKIDVSDKSRCHADGAWGMPFVVADNPTGLALVDDERTVLVWSQAAATVTVIPYDGGIATASHWTPANTSMARRAWRQWEHELVRKPRDERAEKLARGRELFHATNDHHVSSTGVACASCHIGGRDDALVWPTPRGPRQTPMLAGRLVGTGPYGWTGEHATLPEYLAQTFTRLGGAGYKGDDLDALVAYVESIPTPVFAAKDSAAIARGQAIFASPEARCNGCHSGARFIDQDRHDVKSSAPADQQGMFDTPSLLFVGGTAPYFHDGRYSTLLDVIEKNDDAMGHTSHLTPEQRHDLVAYLRSLGAEAPRPAPEPRSHTTAMR